MKEIIFGMILGVVASVANATEQNHFYVGAGVAELVNPNGLSTVPEERGYLSDPAYWGSSNVKENRRIANTFTLGYQVNKTFAVELGYIRGDKGATSKTSANGIGGSDKGNFLYGVHINQKETLTAWHLSLIGQKPLNEFVAITGRVGLINVSTAWEERLRYDVPSNYGGNGMTQLWERSGNKESLLLGIGVNARVAKNTDLRIEILKSDALPAPVPEVSLIVHL